MTAKYNDGTEFVDEFNTVIFAIGRDACTGNMGLDKVRDEMSLIHNFHGILERKDKMVLIIFHGKLQLLAVPLN